MSKIGSWVFDKIFGRKLLTDDRVCAVIAEMTPRPAHAEDVGEIIANRVGRDISKRVLLTHFDNLLEAGRIVAVWGGEGQEGIHRRKYAPFFAVLRPELRPPGKGVLLTPAREKK